MAAHRRVALVALTTFLIGPFSSYRLFAAAKGPSSACRVMGQAEVSVGSRSYGR